MARGAGVPATVGAALVVVALAACARAGSARDAADTATTRAPEDAATAALVPRDTVRGVVSVTGADPAWRLTLTTAAGAAYDVTSAGGTATPLDELRAADHLEVTLLGNEGPGSGELPGARGFVMTSFLVRAADGADAQDGVLIREPTGDALRLMDGTALPIATLPQSLEGQVGARIFWVGATDLPPAAYGVLRAPVPLRLPR
jgi:hypothetical protein